LTTITGEDFAKCVDAYCSIHGVSKGQLDIETGISSSNLAQWRAGGNPSRGKILTFEKFSGMDIEELLSLLDGNKKTATPEGDGSRQEFIRAWDEASPEQRALALATLKLKVSPAESQEKP